MFFVRVSLITKRLEILNQNSLKQFAYDWQYPIKKWFTLFAYRPPQKNDKYVFFNELNKILRKAVNSYKNINVIAEVTLSIFSCFFIFFMILAIFHPFQHFFFFFFQKNVIFFSEQCHLCSYSPQSPEILNCWLICILKKVSSFLMFIVSVKFDWFDSSLRNSIYSCNNSCCFLVGK